MTPHKPRASLDQLTSHYLRSSKALSDLRAAHIERALGDLGTTSGGKVNAAAREVLDGLMTAEQKARELNIKCELAIAAAFEEQVRQMLTKGHSGSLAK